MSRYSGSGSQRHHIQRLEPGCYRLSWTVDRYYPGSRLRFERRCSRDTDEKGARRFAKRWNLPMPGEVHDIDCDMGEDCRCSRNKMQP